MKRRREGEHFRRAQFTQEGGGDHEDGIAPLPSYQDEKMDEPEGMDDFHGEDFGIPPLTAEEQAAPEEINNDTTNNETTSADKFLEAAAYTQAGVGFAQLAKSVYDTARAAHAKVAAKLEERDNVNKVNEFQADEAAQLASKHDALEKGKGPTGDTKLANTLDDPKIQATAVMDEEDIPRDHVVQDKNDLEMEDIDDPGPKLQEANPGREPPVEMSKTGPGSENIEPLPNAAEPPKAAADLFSNDNPEYTVTRGTYDDGSQFGHAAPPDGTTAATNPFSKNYVPPPSIEEGAAPAPKPVMDASTGTGKGFARLKINDDATVHTFTEDSLANESELSHENLSDKPSTLQPTKTHDFSYTDEVAAQKAHSFTIEEGQKVGHFQKETGWFAPEDEVGLAKSQHYDNHYDPKSSDPKLSEPAKGLGEEMDEPLSQGKGVSFLARSNAEWNSAAPEALPNETGNPPSIIATQDPTATQQVESGDVQPPSSSAPGATPNTTSDSTQTYIPDPPPEQDVEPPAVEVDED